MKITEELLEQLGASRTEKDWSLDLGEHFVYFIHHSEGTWTFCANTEWGNWISVRTLQDCMNEIANTFTMIGESNKAREIRRALKL